MKRELEDCLMKDYSKVFRKRCMTRRENCMPFGFECKDGWFEIIRKASEVINNEIAKYPVADQRRFYATRVYEKDGKLNIELSDCTDKMEAAVYHARENSVTICEECGQEGHIRQMSGFSSTLCDACNIAVVQRSKTIKESTPVEKKDEF